MYFFFFLRCLTISFSLPPLGNSKTKRKRKNKMTTT